MTQTIAIVVWSLGMILWWIIRIPHQRRARKQAVKSHRKSMAERAALAAAAVGLVVVPLIHIFTGAFRFADYPFQPLLAWTGAILLVLFLWLFRESHRHLGRNWSITLEIREEHKLVTEGLYRYVRHPMYAAFWLWALAQSLLFANWVAGISGLIGVGILYFSRVGKEEAMMRANFGQEYDDYCRTTGRVIPKI